MTALGLPYGPGRPLKVYGGYTAALPSQRFSCYKLHIAVVNAALTADRGLIQG